jgi:hypothetical protein
MKSQHCGRHTKPLAAADRLDHDRRSWIEAIQKEISMITD